MARTRRVPRIVPRRALVRLLVAFAAGIAGAFAMPAEAPALRVVVGWNVFALTLLCVVWAVIWHADPGETARRAAMEDPGRRTVFVLAVLASSVSLFAAVVVMRHASRLAPDHAGTWVALCLGAVAGSWLLTHSFWALRYAHLYYREDDEGVGGLAFPGGVAPDLMDFAYFSFTIGTCFQTSDVSIASPQIRRAVLFHAVQSFAFTTAILGLALNLAIGFVG